jgi:hypothetical protein
MNRVIRAPLREGVGGNSPALLDQLKPSKSFFIRLDPLKSTSHPMPGIKQLDRNGQQLPPVRRVRL